MTGVGFYTPPQLATIVARDQALTNVVTHVNPSYIAKPPATFNLPTRGTVPDAQWDAIFSQLVADTDAAHQLGLVYALTGVRGTEAAADAIIYAYATTTTAVGGGDSPLAMAECGAGLILADILISTWTARPARHASVFLTWLSKVYRPACDAIAYPARANNWGAWGLFGSLLASRHLGDGPAFAATTGQLQAAINAMIGPQGQMPQELLRTGSQLWYSYFALVPLTAAARVVKNAGGIDLFASSGKLQLALAYLARMYGNQTANTGAQKPTPATPWPMDLFAAMAAAYSDDPSGVADEWAGLAAPFAPIAYWGHHTGWNVPTLTAVVGQ